MKFALHSYRRCPFCIRVRTLLVLKKIPYEIVEEPLRVWTQWMNEWSEKNNEKPRVPVLRIVEGDGVENVIPESNDINLFLDAIQGTPEYTPEIDSPAYSEMLEWFNWCAKEFKPTIDLYKYGENRIFDTERHIFHVTELQKHVKKLENELENRKYLIDERLTLADIAIIPFIRQIMRTREGEFDFSVYPTVLVWANSILETDSFKNEVMKEFTY